MWVVWTESVLCLSAFALVTQQLRQPCLRPSALSLLPSDVMAPRFEVFLNTILRITLEKVLQLSASSLVMNTKPKGMSEDTCSEHVIHIPPPPPWPHGAQASSQEGEGGAGQVSPTVSLSCGPLRLGFLSFYIVNFHMLFCFPTGPACWSLLCLLFIN